MQHVCQENVYLSSKVKALEEERQELERMKSKDVADLERANNELVNRVKQLQKNLKIARLIWQQVSTFETDKMFKFPL